MNFDGFFHALPFVPLKEVSRHIKKEQLIPLSMYSDQWREAIAQSGIRRKCDMTVKLTDDRLECLISIEPSHFHSTSTMTVLFEKADDDTVEVRFEQNEIRYSAADFKSKCLRWMRTMESIFTASYEHISVKVTDPQFATELMSLLPRGSWAKCVKFECDSKYTVNSRHMTTFLEKLDFNRNGSVHIGGQMDNVVKSERICLKMYHIFIEDARFLARGSLTTLDCHRGEFGRNQFTCGDFNAFLAQWKAETTPPSFGQRIIFHITDDQLISVEEVLRGLDAQPFDAQRRDRYTVEFLDANDPHCFKPTLIDLRDAIDFTNAHGTLASVLVSNSQLMFVDWGTGKFHIRSLVWRLEKEIECWQDVCNQLTAEREMVDYSIGWHLERLESINEQLEERGERIQAAQALLARARAEWQT